ncbi:hypothetical protein HYFRA_00010917 [Hymenoscyphus fraxineus]|uniref:Uncharacterized protein n=1 Tax=Hymenoscyphus fraxineus TaxID=746836 RepID=A0A9N9KZM4_9HELO|nr:hypothetical protein HYFRA_00010917 [Hymenoscyphus fraxineus]
MPGRRGKENDNLIGFEFAKKDPGFGKFEAQDNVVTELERVIIGWISDEGCLSKMSCIGRHKGVREGMGSISEQSACAVPDAVAERDGGFLQASDQPAPQRRERTGKTDLTDLTEGQQGSWVVSVVRQRSTAPLHFCDSDSPFVPRNTHPSLPLASPRSSLPPLPRTSSRPQIQPHTRPSSRDSCTITVVPVVPVPSASPLRVSSGPSSPSSPPIPTPPKGKVRIPVRLRLRLRLRPRPPYFYMIQRSAVPTYVGSKFFVQPHRQQYPSTTDNNRQISSAYTTQLCSVVTVAGRSLKVVL